MNVVIIDDEPPAIALLSTYIQRTKSLTLQASFTDPLNALGLYNSHHPPQLTFLDVDMPGINGIDLARIIRAKTQIILTTSFRKYGPEAFELSLCDYLLKPFSFERFLAAVHKADNAQSPIAPTIPDYFYVRTSIRGKYQRIEISEIQFIESQDNQILIKTSPNTTMAQHPLSDIIQWLPPSQFQRVHRSFVVNLAEISAIDHGRLQMKNGTDIPIGRQYREALMQQLQRFIIGNRH